MALFEYFPNYIWNLSVAMALESGGRIGEIVDMCQPIRDAAANGADAGTPQFMAQWVAKDDTLIELAGEDEAAGRNFSASDKLERAALYLLVAERMQQQGSTGRPCSLNASPLPGWSTQSVEMPRRARACGKPDHQSSSFELSRPLQ